jgi:hypothetical protein
MYEINQYVRETNRFEPIPEGEFESFIDAADACTALEADGWTDLLIYRQIIDADGRIVGRKVA